MKNYVISLTSSIDRRGHIIKEFESKGISFDFFDAVTIDKISDLSNQYKIDLTKSSKLSAEEKACFFSHISLWQKIIDDNLDYMAIFEDDIYLGNNANLFFNSDEWLKDKKIDYIKTETFLQKRKLDSNLITLPDNRVAKVINESHLGCGGYIISKKAAISLLNFTKKLPLANLAPIDNIIFDIYLKSNNSIPIYQMLPAIVVQEFILHPNNLTMPSNIEESRRERIKNRPKRSISEKLSGELRNAYRKTIGSFSRKMVDFQ